MTSSSPNIKNMRILVRRDTADNWTAADPVLLIGEAGYETDERGLKYGDGVSLWSDLPYFQGKGTKIYTPIVEELIVDEDAGITEGSESYEYITAPSGEKVGVEVQYASWNDALADVPVTPAPDPGKRRSFIFGVADSVPVTLEMPAGANAALVFLQNYTHFNHLESGGTISAPVGTVTVPKTKTTLRITSGNAEYVQSGLKSAFGDERRAILEVVDTSVATYEEQEVREFGDKYTVMKFDSESEITFMGRFDIRSANNAKIRASLGRVVIIPFYTDDDDIIGTASSYGTFADEADEYSDGDEDWTDWSLEVEASLNCKGFREMIRRAIFALESRKNYKPAPHAIPGGKPADDTEYDTLIHAFWDVLDDESLVTLADLNTAVSGLLEEAGKSKYGIGSLFEYEKQSGITGYNLL